MTSEIARAAMRLFTDNYHWGAPIRSLTVTACDLAYGETAAQLTLFDDESARLRAEQAERAVDDIRRRFGYAAVGRAVFLKDASIGLINPKDDHVVHPVGFLKNGSMSDVTGGQA